MLNTFDTRQALCLNTNQHKFVEWEMLLVAMRYSITCMINAEWKEYIQDAGVTK